MKIKQNKIIKNIFFFKKKKEKKKKRKTKNNTNKIIKQKDAVQKNKIKNVYWPFVTKMTTSTKFPKKDVLTSNIYKRTLRTHLTFN